MDVAGVSRAGDGALARYGPDPGPGGCPSISPAMPWPHLPIPARARTRAFISFFLSLCRHRDTISPARPCRHRDTISEVPQYSHSRLGSLAQLAPSLSANSPIKPPIHRHARRRRSSLDPRPGLISDKDRVPAAGPPAHVLGVIRSLFLVGIDRHRCISIRHREYTRSRWNRQGPADRGRGRRVAVPIPG